MALQYLRKSSRRHPDLFSWGAPIHELIERKSPAPDYTGEPGDLFPPDEVDTSIAEMDAADESYVDPTYCGCSECGDAEPQVERYTDLLPASEIPTEMLYASVLTLDEINFHGGFIVTTNRSYT